MADWRELAGDQNIRLANKMLEQQGEINGLRTQLAEAREERDELAEQAVALIREGDRARREADTWWKRSEKQVDTIADLRHAYELKVADLAKETNRVEILARVLLDDNHSPDGFHAEGDRCRHCAALRKALRPEEGADRG